MSCKRTTAQRVKGVALQRSAIAFAVVFPTILTFAYFVALADSPASFQQTTYAIGKCIQFGFPLFWVWYVLREKICCGAPAGSGAAVAQTDGHAPAGNEMVGSPRATRGLVMGLAFGGLVSGAMLALYFFGIKPSGLMQPLQATVWDKVNDMGLTAFWKYAAVGVFYSLAHSFLEEYYWRWFVFGQLRRERSLWVSMIVSSLGFMAHHVILLTMFFGFSSPLGYIFSLAVAVGGLAWAYIYENGRSLLGPWLSHMAVDAAIFMIGYDLVREQLLDY